DVIFFFSSRRRHTRSKRDWSSDVCSSDVVALGAGRLYEVRPLRVRAARWDSLHVRRSDGPPVAGQVEGRLSGEPPHKSKTNSFFGPPPFLCASTVGPGGRAAQWIIPGAKKSTQHHGRWVAQPDGN